MMTLRTILTSGCLALPFAIACSGTSNDDADGSGGGVSQAGGMSSIGGTPGAGGDLSTGGVASGGTSVGGTAAGGTSIGGSDAAGGADTGAGGEPMGGGSGGDGEPSGGADDGSGGEEGALVEPIERDGAYVFEFGSVKFVISPEDGARITEFSYDGEDVLSSTDANNWGSTFWTSPQAAWGWPPEDAINTATYTAVLDGSIVTLTNQESDLESSSVVIEKTISANLSAGAIDIIYTITNTGGSSVDVAPWEISRVASGGITFFPLGTDGPLASPDNNDLTTVASEGMIWFEEANQVYDSDTNSGNHKIHADGDEGWLAHASASGMIFMKTFGDVSFASTAPDHGEIELYSAGDYVEVENQGSMESLAPDASLSYAVRWALRPASAAIAVGSELADEARSFATEIGTP